MQTTQSPPRYIVTADQMRQAEAKADAQGDINYDQMMEKAGAAVAQAVDEVYGAAEKKITILVGPGNNGGDGLVAARYLARMGAMVAVILWNRRSINAPDVAQRDPNWERLQHHGVLIIRRNEQQVDGLGQTWLAQSDIIIDALLGTGVSRPIQGDLADLLSQVKTIIQPQANSSHILCDPLKPSKKQRTAPYLVAVDLPSGLNSDTGALDAQTLAADLTITFAAVKRGHITWPGAEAVGRLLIADIALQPDHFPAQHPLFVTPNFVSAWLPQRPATGHKGTFGKTMIVAGCRHFTGAPYLSGTAAGRVGAGLVTVALPQTIQPTISTHLTEATYLPLPDHDSALDSRYEGYIATEAVPILTEVLASYNALLIGPGLGQAPSTADFITDLLLSNRHLDDQWHLPPLVLDADALNYLAQQPSWWESLPSHCILTPHPGEMSRLANQVIDDLEAQRLEIVSTLAQRWKQIVVYKGAYSVIANPEGDVAVLPFANPALATAGSGDVLAGTIAGLLGQGLEPFAAAVTGGYLHGLAGEMARDDFWQAGVVASDLLPRLPMAMKKLATVE